MVNAKKDEFDLLRKFSCSTCLAVMESIEEESQFLHEITRAAKAGRKEVSECLRFAEENLLVEKRGENCYSLSNKGKEALKRFKDVSPLICEP
jgi:predicted transcriptional regulator